MKFNIKQKAVASTLSVSLLFGSIAPANAGGIPVFDGAAVAQAIQQGIQMGQQIQNQVEQIEKAGQQLKALTGSRNLGNILKTEALEQLPDEWKSVYSAAMNAKEGNFKDILNSKGYNQNGDTDRLIKHYSLTYKAIKDSEVRFKNIKALMDRVNTTQDAKAAADLQNRIQLETAYIQQNQTQLDMMERYMALDEKVQVKKRQERDRCIRQNQIKGTSGSCA